MTHHLAGRVWLEQNQLYAVAREFDDLSREIVFPSSPAGLPDLVTASRQLSALSGLVNDLSDEVQLRASDENPGIDRGPVIYAYTAASAHTGQALAHFTEAYHQLGFLRRHAGTPGSGDLRDARESAFRVVQDRLEQVHDSLHAVGRELRGSADRLGTTPPRVIAALSRSAPANPVHRAPVPEAARAPTVRLAYTPEPRRGR